MGIQAGVGMSHHRNPQVAGHEAVRQALAAAAIDKPDFVFLFGTVGYNQQALVHAVREAAGSAPLCGCSGEGVVACGEADESNFAVGVMAIRSDQLRFRNGLATGLKQDPTGAGRAVAQAIQPDVRADTLALFLFPDGLTVNFDRLLAGLEGQLGLEHPLPLLGGNASDNLEFKPTSCTFQYCDDQVISDGIAWTLLSGQAKIAWAVNHACVPVSVESKVTRCEGNVIYEIDGRPALDVVKGYLTDAEIEDWAMAIATFPLGFKVPELAQDYDEYIIRGMVGGRDEPTGSVTIHTEVTEGTSVWVTRRDYEKLAQGVERIAREIKAKLGNCTPKLVFHFDCAARGKALLREQQKLELLQTLQRHLGPESPWLGFYTLGEIGPVGRRNYLHNFTLVMAVIY